MASESEGPPSNPEDEHPAASAAPGRLVGSPHATAAHEAVVALVKAARSFTLYDPANKVVRKLIGEYREKTQGALASFGDLVLVVHPYELLLGEEVVYKELDRERSLAFRLFRDGVRRLHFGQGTTWDELIRLLQILSIRFTAVRQQEEDLVTLLRKAGFEHIRIAAIEGFVPEEEQSEAAPATQRRPDVRREPPARWDLPMPSLTEAAPLRYRPVSEELLERVRAEEAAETAAPEAVRVTLELLQLAGGEDLETLTRFALEAREFLLVEGRIDLVVELVRGARTALQAVPGAADRFVGECLDEATIGAVAGSLPPDARELPRHLTEVLKDAPPAVALRLVDLLVADATGPRAPLLRRLVTMSGGPALEAVLARLGEVEGAPKVTLLQLLVELDRSAGLRAAVDATTSKDEAVQLEALRQLQDIPFSPEIARALRHLVESTAEKVRLQALPVMAARGQARVTPTLVAHAEKRYESLSAAEAEATGRALARSSPRAGLDAFKAWLESTSGGGLLGRKVTLDAPPTLQRVALAGLELIGGEEAEALLHRLVESGTDEVAGEAELVLERRGAAHG